MKGGGTMKEEDIIYTFEICPSCRHKCIKDNGKTSIVFNSNIGRYGEYECENCRIGDVKNENNKN